MYPCLNILLTCVREGKQRESVRDFMVSDHRWLTLPYACAVLLIGGLDRFTDSWSLLAESRS